MENVTISKINAVPQGCTKCWQERKKSIRTVLANMVWPKNTMTLNIPIVGKMEKGDLVRLEKIIKDELIRIKKGYIDITFITT